MNLPELKYACPQTGAKFLTRLTCISRKAKSGNRFCTAGMALTENYTTECAGCPGPVPASEYRPKPITSYPEIPDSSEPPIPKVVAEKRLYNAHEKIPEYGLRGLQLGGFMLIGCPKDLNPRTLKSRLQGEAGKIVGHRYHICMLVNAVRVERVK